jgi:hypothetical protein
MSAKNKIFQELEKMGFDYLPGDTSVIYRGLFSDGQWTNISLYSSLDDAGNQHFGFYIAKTIDKRLQNNLKVELHNVVVGNKCTDPQELPGDGQCWIYCTLSVINDSTIDWLKASLQELERRALFLINK